MEPSSNPALNSKEKKQLNTAIKKIKLYLSNRSHSEKELKQKLSTKFPENIIKVVLQLAKQKKWLESPAELSKKISETLHQKNKSWRYIQSYLKNKELPLPLYRKKKEIKKAKNLLYKLSHFHKKTPIQMRQYLVNRSFETDIIDELLEESSQF